MRMLCAVFAWMVNARIAMSSYSVTCATWPFTRSVMVFLTFLKGSGSAVGAFNPHLELLTVLSALIVVEPSNRQMMDGGLMLFVLSGFLKSVLPTL